MLLALDTTSIPAGNYEWDGVSMRPIYSERMLHIQVMNTNTQLSNIGLFQM